MSNSPRRDTHGDEMGKLLRKHASERIHWQSWGHTLRTEAAKLDGSEQKFTKAFLLSGALQGIFRSVFRSRLNPDERNDLTFIMKTCLMNSDISLSVSKRTKNKPCNAHEEAAQRTLSTTSNGGSDFVEDVCGRLVRLGEEFIKTAERRKSIASMDIVDPAVWLSSDDENSPEAKSRHNDDASEGKHDSDNESNQADDPVTPHTPKRALRDSSNNFIEDAVNCVTNALSALRVNITQPDGALTSLDPLRGSGDAFSSSSADMFPRLNSSGAVAFTSGYCYPVAAPSEPACDDAFHRKRSLQQLTLSFPSQSPSIPGASSFDDIPVTPHESPFVDSQTSPGSGFGTPFGFHTPSEFQEHDAWAEYHLHRSEGKIAEALREASLYLSQKEYDEQIRFGIDAQRATLENALSRLERRQGRISLAMFCKEKEKFELDEAKKRKLTASEHELQFLTTAKQNTVVELHKLEREVGRVKAVLKQLDDKLIEANKQAKRIEDEYALMVKEVSKQQAKLQSLRNRVDVDSRAVRISKVYVDGVLKRASDETSKSLSHQEEVLRHQVEVAAHWSHEAAQRFGMVMSMLEYSKSTLGRFCHSNNKESSPTTKSLVKTFADELTHWNTDRREKCSEVARRIRDLVEKIKGVSENLVPERSERLVTEIERLATNVSEGTMMCVGSTCSNAGVTFPRVASNALDLGTTESTALNEIESQSTSNVCGTKKKVPKPLLTKKKAPSNAEMDGPTGSSAEHYEDHLPEEVLTILTELGMVKPWTSSQGVTVNGSPARRPAGPQQGDSPHSQ